MKITDLGSGRVKVMKEIRALTGHGLKEVRLIIIIAVVIIMIIVIIVVIVVVIIMGYGVSVEQQPPIILVLLSYYTDISFIIVIQVDSTTCFN